MVLGQLPALVMPLFAPATANALDGDAAVLATLAADKPTAIAVNSVTNRIYVALAGPDFSPSTVRVIDGATHGLIATVPVGVNPSDIIVNESTNTIYVTNSGGTTGGVTVIDGLTSTVTATLGVFNPLKAALDATRSRLYVSHGGDSGVTVFDTTSNTAVRSVTVSAYGVAVDPVSNRLYVGALGGSTIRVLDAADLSAPTIATIAVGGEPNNIVVN